MALTRYTFIGAAATAAHYLTLVLLVEALRIRPGWAAMAGAAVGALVAYGGNHRYTFAATQTPHQRALPRFMLVAVLGGLGNGLVVWLGTDSLGLNYLLAQFIATGLMLLLTYHLNRTWTFA